MVQRTEVVGTLTIQVAAETKIAEIKEELLCRVEQRAEQLVALSASEAAQTSLKIF